MCKFSKGIMQNCYKYNQNNGISLQPLGYSINNRSTIICLASARRIREYSRLCRISTRIDGGWKGLS